MPRLLLVARNPGLAFGLASASDDIIEVRPSLVGRLSVSPGMADVVVIEQERPEDALATLDLLRAGGLMAPALLVASARPEWTELDPGARPSVAVLDPPITQDRLELSVGSTSTLPEAHLLAEDPEPEPVAEALPGDGAEPVVEQMAPVESDVPAAAEAPAPDRVGVVFSDAQAVEELPIAAAAADAQIAGEDEAPLDATAQTETEPPEDEHVEAEHVEAEHVEAEHVEAEHVEAELPDGPLDLEPEDDPYATATHVDLPEGDDLDHDVVFEKAALDEPSEEPAEEAAEAPEPAPDVKAAAEETADAGDHDPVTAALIVAALSEDRADDEAVVDDTESDSDVEAEESEEADEPAPVIEDADGAEDDDTSGETGDPELETAELETAELETAELETAERDDDAQVVLDAAMLAIPTAAPMRAPEEIRLGTIGRDVLPAVVLYDEEDELSVAEGTPSPASWRATPTEPVLAWEGTSTTRDGRVYAEMASLVAASGELLADEPETTEQPYDEGAWEDIPSVDLSQVFGDPGDSPWPAAVAVAAATSTVDDEPFGTALDSEEPPLTHDEPMLPVEAETEAALANAVPEPRAHVDVVDLRETPEDPRSTPSLVRALLSRSHEVYGVSEAGALVVGDALARTGASAGALLLPDGDSWRVAAGEGLRRLEHRYVLSADSWLVTTIASRHKGIIIDRTDVARRPLAGAPLAAHKHLVAAPVRAVAGILLIARDDEPPFGERDLLSLARLAEASAGILASALDARQLARLLGDIRDQDDRAAAERIDYGL